MPELYNEENYMAHFGASKLRQVEELWSFGGVFVMNQRNETSSTSTMKRTGECRNGTKQKLIQQLAVVEVFNAKVVHHIRRSGTENEAELFTNVLIAQDPAVGNTRWRGFIQSIPTFQSLRTL